MKKRKQKKRLSGAAAALLERLRGANGPVGPLTGKARGTALVLLREGLATLRVAEPGKKTGEVREVVLTGAEFRRSEERVRARVRDAWVVLAQISEAELVRGWTGGRK